MGSRSDWETMRHAADTLAELDVPHEVRVVSAHRTPDLLFEYADGAAGRGLEVIVAGAGGAAHLPGMCAAKTTLPVLGVPVESKALQRHRLAALHRADAGRASRSGRSPSGAPARSTPRCWPRPSWPAGRPELGERLAAWRRARTEAVLADPDPRAPAP